MQVNSISVSGAPSSLLCLCPFLFLYLYSSYLIFLILTPPPRNVWTLSRLDPDNRQAFMPTQHLGYSLEPNHWSSCLHDKCFIYLAIYPALIWIFKTGSFIELRDQKLDQQSLQIFLFPSPCNGIIINMCWGLALTLVLLIEPSPQLLFPALRDNIIIENLFFFLFALKHLCLCDTMVVWRKFSKKLEILYVFLHKQRSPVQRHARIFN